MKVDDYTNIYEVRDGNAEGCVTAKYLTYGGIHRRNKSNGLGVYYELREMLKNDAN